MDLHLKMKVPGDWPPSLLALPGLGRGRLAPASLEVEGLGSLPWARGQPDDGQGEACVPTSEYCVQPPTYLPWSCTTAPQAAR